ncbi:hypothetical protein O3P69_002361 [Scylla paramamosain]|uniref:Secreted protein n=1 Tax=Scylla paramamosain TaxID=85552 RepID=A0AAW0V6E6_SCYPA
MLPVRQSARHLILVGTNCVKTVSGKLERTSSAFCPLLLLAAQMCWTKYSTKTDVTRRSGYNGREEGRRTRPARQSSVMYGEK